MIGHPSLNALLTSLPKANQARTRRAVCGSMSPSLARLEPTASCTATATVMVTPSAYIRLGRGMACLLSGLVRRSDGRLDGCSNLDLFKTSAPVRRVRSVKSSTTQASVMVMTLFSPSHPLGGRKCREEFVPLRLPLNRCRAILSIRWCLVGWHLGKNLPRYPLVLRSTDGL